MFRYEDFQAFAEYFDGSVKSKWCKVIPSALALALAPPASHLDHTGIALYPNRPQASATQRQRLLHALVGRASGDRALDPCFASTITTLHSQAVSIAVHNMTLVATAAVCLRWRRVSRPPVVPVCHTD